MSDDPPQTLFSSEGISDGDTRVQHDGVQELPVARAFHRVVRAVMFDDTPDPELELLPLAQLRLLWAVFYRNDATMKDFSECLGVAQSTVTQLADRLVRRGLVERNTDLADRRVIHLQVSKVGRQLLEDATRRQHSTLRDVWARISPAERPVVLRGLELLAGAAETVRSEQGRARSSLPLHVENGIWDATADPATSQPMVNLMARRIRGKKSV